MEDKKVQSFIGTDSTLQNVMMVPKEYLWQMPKLHESDLDLVFEGISDINGETHVNKMREMIWKRWCELDRI